VDVADFVDELERQGGALADAAATTGPDALVPTCPGWTVRDLLVHTGGVHDWARSFVEGDPDADPDAAEEDLSRPDGEPLGWYRDRHAALVGALRAAPPDLGGWTLLPAPTPLTFWARRQAHEAAVHRADADSAAGGADPAAFSTTFAVDGIDELLLAFMARSGRLRSDVPYTLAVVAEDADAPWLVEVGAGGARARRGTGPAGCTLRAPAGALYLFLWNRVPDVAVEGDAALAARWREQARVTWS
jgi:uncharacterized protein (TIGR03083 family)